MAETMARLTLSNGEFLDYTLTLPSAPSRSPLPPAVIFLHGFASDQKGEKALYFCERFVAAGAAYLAFDMRGHGASSGGMKDLTITRCLTDLEAIMRIIPPACPRRILVGSSFGGVIATLYAIRHPEEIAATILIAPGLFFVDNLRRSLGQEGLRKLEGEGAVTVKSEWVEITLGRALFDDALNYPAEELLARARVPTLILHGTDDTVVPPEGSLAFLRKAPARPLSLHLIAGGDHRLTAHKEALFQHMLAFCKDLGLL